MALGSGNRLEARRLILRVGSSQDGGLEDGGPKTVGRKKVRSEVLRCTATEALDDALGVVMIRNARGFSRDSDIYNRISSYDRRRTLRNSARAARRFPFVAWRGRSLGVCEVWSSTQTINA